MSATTTARPFEVGDRVRITTRRVLEPDEIVDGVVTELARGHMQSPITMWIKRDVPSTFDDGSPRLLGAAYVTDDLTGPFYPLSTQIELLSPAPTDPSTGAVTAPTPAPSDAPAIHILDRIPGEPNPLDPDPVVGFTAAVEVDSGATWYERPTVWLTPEQHAALGEPQQIEITVKAVTR